MARVFEAEHVQLKKKVAIKVLHDSLRGDPTQIARFLREGRAAARVRHLHVVQVFDVGLEQGVPYLVMEFLEGETLAQLLRERGVLSLALIAEVFLPTISAVASAHDQGLVHRDLKPSNVMLTLHQRGSLHPMVVDFGISKLDDEDDLTASGQVIGTLQYLAPEQVRAAKLASPRSDQYALGAMLYECVTGKRPFSAESQYELLHSIATGKVRSPSELNPSLPPAIVDPIRRAMRLDPELRFASVRQLGQALLPLATPAVRARWAHEFAPRDAAPSDDTAVSVSLPSKSVPPVTPSESKASRSTSGVGLGLVALGLVVAAAAGAFLMIGTGQRVAASQDARTAALDNAQVVSNAKPAAPRAEVAAAAAAPAPPAVTPPSAPAAAPAAAPPTTQAAAPLTPRSAPAAASTRPVAPRRAAPRAVPTTESGRATPSKQDETMGSNGAPIIE
jgi:serine/threonine-protein kinase